MSDTASLPFPELHAKEMLPPSEMFGWVDTLHQPPVSAPAFQEPVFESLNEKEVAPGRASQEEIQRLLENAKRDAEAILELATREASAINQQAWQEGYEAGKDHWEAAIEDIATTLRTQLEQFQSQLLLSYQTYMSTLEQEMFKLTMQIARKVVKEEVRQHPEVVLSVIQDALRRVSDSGSIRVRVNPLDLEMARKGKNHLLKVVEGARGFEIVEDRRVEPGSCVIDTEHGIIDARLNLQLDEIERALQIQPFPVQEVQEARQDAA